MLSAPTKIQTAFHEAGHAVIAHRSKFMRIKPGSSISIVETGDEYGGVEVETDTSAPSTTEHRQAYEMSLIAAAGWIAQHRYLKEHNQPVDQTILNTGASDDMLSVRQRFGVGVFFEFGAVVQSRFDNDMLWHQVKVLAEALAQKGALTLSEVEALIGPR